MKILNVVGARPNFIKIAPIHRALSNKPEFESILVHTGQHYDLRMSEIFFRQLNLPEPAYFLGVGSGTHTFQTAHIMLRFEEVLEKEKPELVIVVGDVNSTLACALVSAKNQIPLAHVEAGLRSFDRSMPEEINRILTDQIADFLFVTEQSGLDHLISEGIDRSKIHFVGNVMIDSLKHLEEPASKIEIERILQDNNHMRPIPEEFALMTMHRPQNVDRPVDLKRVLEIIETCLDKIPVIFPMHPRTKKNLIDHGFWTAFKDLKKLFILEPQGYFEFLKLMKTCKFIVTDSGGIQEESSYLQKPCITFRNSTERPVTINMGSNYLVKNLDSQKFITILNKIMEGSIEQGQIPPLWDGHSAERIVDVLVNQKSS